MRYTPLIVGVVLISYVVSPPRIPISGVMTIGSAPLVAVSGASSVTRSAPSGAAVALPSRSRILGSTTTTSPARS
jgi:hypothetical protein